MHISDSDKLNFRLENINMTQKTERTCNVHDSIRYLSSQGADVKKIRSTISKVLPRRKVPKSSVSGCASTHPWESIYQTCSFIFWQEILRILGQKIIKKYETKITKSVKNFILISTKLKNGCNSSFDLV